MGNARVGIGTLSLDNVWFIWFSLVLELLFSVGLLLILIFVLNIGDIGVVNRNGITTGIPFGLIEKSEKILKNIKKKQKNNKNIKKLKKYNKN